MKVIFDQGVPVPLRREPAGHAVDTSFERGWSGLANGDPLNAAEAGGYDVLVTTYQNIKHQQNLAARRIAVVVLLSTAWPKIRRRVSEVAAAINVATPGSLVEVPI